MENSICPKNLGAYNHLQSQKEVNFYIPVSVTDLGFQLYWYLIEGKPVGTHPTAEDVERIKQEKPNFRDFHVLQLGLTKQ